MPRYVTIGYGDRDGYDRTAPILRDAAHAHDRELLASGAIIGTAGKPVQVRNHDGTGAETTAGAYLRSDLPVAGFGLIDAATLAEAVELAAQSPCAIAHGVIEVWPLEEQGS
jgi:Uncharacterized protein conserved in bacteria